MSEPTETMRLGSVRTPSRTALTRPVAAAWPFCTSWIVHWFSLLAVLTSQTQTCSGSCCTHWMTVWTMVFIAVPAVVAILAPHSPIRATMSEPQAVMLSRVDWNSWLTASGMVSRPFSRPWMM